MITTIVLIRVTKHINVCHFFNFISIHLILFSFESETLALYHKSKRNKKSEEVKWKKWRRKKSTSLKMHIWGPFSHTQWPHLSHLQICNCFFIWRVISLEIRVILGAIDGKIRYFPPIFDVNRTENNPYF